MRPTLLFFWKQKRNVLHTKLIHRCSDLKADLYRVGLTIDSSCSCGINVENSIHFFFECILYQRQRRVLLNSLQRYQPINLDFILNGNCILSNEENKEICFHVHKYINETKRLQ